MYVSLRAERFSSRLLTFLFFCCKLFAAMHGECVGVRRLFEMNFHETSSRERRGYRNIIRCIVGVDVCVFVCVCVCVERNGSHWKPTFCASRFDRYGTVMTYDIYFDLDMTRPLVYRLV